MAIHRDLPQLREPGFAPMSAEEAQALRGGAGAVGVCLAIGYACWEKGSFRLGLCFLPGVVRK